MGTKMAATGMGTTKPTEVAVFAGDSPKVRKIGGDRPWVWLGRGWNDMRRAPRVSFAWGLGFVIFGLIAIALLFFFQVYYLILPFAAGFMLVAPVLVVGLYEVSHRLEDDLPVTMTTPYDAWRRNISQVAFMGFVLGLFFLAWMRLATLLFAVFFGESPPNMATFMDQVVLSTDNIWFLICGTAVGAVLAAIVFAIAAVSVPMLLDRHTNVFVAMATSAVAVRENPFAMAVWGILIVLFVAAGMALGFVGLIVTLPLIAHATWHAYRDIVVPVGEETRPAIGAQQQE